jgi:Neprosin
VEGDKYYGAKATINVWEPKIEQSNEFSLSQLWILGGSFGQDLNSIEAGWQVIHILICKSTSFFQSTFEFVLFL